MTAAVIEHRGMRSEAQSTVRPLCLDIEGMPTELTQHAIRARRSAPLENLVLELSVLGDDLGYGELVLPANGGLSEAWLSDWWRLGDRPDWLAPFDHSRPAAVSGWSHTEESFVRSFAKTGTMRELGCAVKEFASAALQALGMFPPWMWYFQISFQPSAPGPRKLVDLRSLDSRTHPPIRFPGCGSQGLIAHSLGECDVHTRCDALDCDSLLPSRVGLPKCGGCAGLAELFGPTC